MYHILYKPESPLHKLFGAHGKMAYICKAFNTIFKSFYNCKNVRDGKTSSIHCVN